MPSEGRLNIAGDRDHPDAEAFQMRDQGEQLVGLTALGNEYCHVVAADDSQVSVNAVDRVQESGWGSGGCQCRGNLAADETRFPHSTDDESALAGVHELDRADKLVADALLDDGERLLLEVQHMPAAFGDLFAIHRDLPVARTRGFDVERLSLPPSRDRSATYASVSAPHSPRVLSSISANSRTAPRPPPRES